MVGPCGDEHVLTGKYTGVLSNFFLAIVGGVAYIEIYDVEACVSLFEATTVAANGLLQQQSVIV